MTTYNGWKNYETWCVHLWLTNDESTDGYWRAAARAEWTYTEDERPEYLSRSEAARIAVADQMKDELEKAAPDLDGMWADLLAAALSEVEWQDIADAFLADCEGYESAK